MFGPALAAFLVRGPLRHEGFKDAGFRPWIKGKTGRYYLAAYLIVPVMIAIAIGLTLALQIQHWAYAENLHKSGQAIAATLVKQGQNVPGNPDQLAEASVFASGFLAFTLILPINMIFTFGEEFGWRGYLLPKLLPLGGWQAVVITGIIWGLWHAPLIALDGYNFPGHPWLGILMMMVFCIAVGAFLAWLRIRSGSIWPGALAHAAINAQAGFGIVFLSVGDSLLSPTVGLMASLPWLVVGIWLAITRRLNPSDELETAYARSV